MSGTLPLPWPTRSPWHSGHTEKMIKLPPEPGITKRPKDTACLCVPGTTSTQLPARFTAQGGPAGRGSLGTGMSCFGSQ